MKALGFGGVVAAFFSGAALAAGVTEADYFSDLPVVLSVSRLAQPQSEVPGAVTVIDQEVIRRSGAREVADVLRLVPGFIMTRWQAGLVSTYHAGMDIYGARMQVYVDGRSVYSSHFLGDTHFGLRGSLRGEVASVAQSVNGDHEIYEPALKQTRRTFMILPLDL